MPASNDPVKDRQIFLKILGMDDEETWHRIAKKNKKKAGSRSEFDSLTYEERIALCDRPENLSGPTPAAWKEINAHLGTNAGSLTELVAELGQRSFGGRPTVGDSFCGGGAIPFEASRLGCNVVGSDLNPVAAFLTWSAINLFGASREQQNEIRAAIAEVYAETDAQIREWGIDHNERGETAEAFLYCVEAMPSGCDYYIPLAPSWIIAEKYGTVVEWEKPSSGTRLNPRVKNVSKEEFRRYKDKKGATIQRGRVLDPFDPGKSWSMESLRGVNGLREWAKEDLVPNENDVFQERLYCIRWASPEGERRYAEPSPEDIDRETKVLSILMKNVRPWEEKGYLPLRKIEAGYNTDQPLRERGWTHWHHLFSPRQLLYIGAFLSNLDEYLDEKTNAAGLILSVMSAADFNSKLCRWIPHLAASGGIGAFAQTYYNQALNTLFNWGCRGFASVKTTLCELPEIELQPNPGTARIYIKDARDSSSVCDLWITDPPYADAVNYHELGDFFLAWSGKSVARILDGNTWDSRSSLAVRGNGEEFKKSMVDVYTSLAHHTSDNGLHIIMFTHKDPSVWADLGMILWAAKLRVTAAWTISTETDPGFKTGDYVQGTVCLVARKRIDDEPGFLFDIYPMVEDEVRSQIASMRDLDDNSEPNFGDSDYQLAAYAAALKVLTQYSSLDGKSVADEVFAIRAKNEKSDFEQVIERAITIACDALIPKGLADSWRDLNLIERYYLRAVDIESRGERRKGIYEELARGFGVADIKPLLKSDKANGTRVHTPSGFGTSLLAPIDGALESAAALPRRVRASASGPHPFAASPLRHLLFAICETAAADNDPNQGRQYLRDTFGQTYWGRRESMVRLLDWLAALGNAEDTADWAKDSEAARILAGRLRNDDA
jgi:putative DNA methylase